MSELKIITREQIDQLVSKREGEIKFGERVQVVSTENWQEELSVSSSPFVLVGIPEDIGVRANFGVGGTHSLWEPALKSLLNVQHTDMLQGESLLVLGAFDFSKLMRESREMSVFDLREAVNTIDDAVFPVIMAIRDAGKIPVIIGGGHNNTYPILKGVSKSLEAAVNCINLDAHSDYRMVEGRHSGNGFRYAKMHGYLKKYALIGLHRNYNSQAVLADMMSDPDIDFSFYEDIFLQHILDFKIAVTNATSFTAGAKTGIELDLDCIDHTMSSAATPCGVSNLLARQYVAHVAEAVDVAYLHITEGSVRMADGRQDMMTAKLVSYFVTDFIRSASRHSGQV